MRLLLFFFFLIAGTPISTGIDTLMVHGANYIVQMGKRDWVKIEALTCFLSILFSNHRTLFELFLKTIGAHYFPFILKNIFASYSLISIILQHILCCPL